MRRPLPRLLLLTVIAVAAPSAEGAAISGVCPDGSIFIVQDRNRIPCAAAKEVRPENVPPIRPSYLPRPYAWQVYREGANPNNPYNLIDAARRVRELQAPPSTSGGPEGAAALPGVASGPGVTQAPSLQAPSFAAAAPPAPDLALSPDDVRDLFLIVEISQQHAPARFIKEDAQGEAELEVSFAWSEAFDARFRGAAPGAGPVVLFSAVAHRPSEFHPNFTFVQGHQSFRPNAEVPLQMGILEGASGALPGEGVVLGYVVLPEHMDPALDCDLYWNDRRIGTVLRP